MKTFMSVLLLIGICFIGFLLGLIFSSTNNVCVYRGVGLDVSPGIIFSNLEHECYRYPEHKEGFVWLCDNGHIEYDPTGVRFPDLETTNEGLL